MRVLLDNDIVLDIVLDRAPFVASAAKIWEAHEAGRITAYVSSVTPVNVFYIARKIKGGDIARQSVIELLNAINICAIDAAVLRNALALPLSDYEDAVQHSAAQAAGLDAIVTRNARDFRASTIPVYAPVDFLALIST